MRKEIGWKRGSRLALCVLGMLGACAGREQTSAEDADQPRDEPEVNANDAHVGSVDTIDSGPMRPGPTWVDASMEGPGRSDAHVANDPDPHVTLDASITDSGDGFVGLDARAPLDGWVPLDAGNEPSGPVPLPVCGVDCECTVDGDTVGWRNYRGGEHSDSYQPDQTVLTAATVGRLEVKQRAPMTATSRPLVAGTSVLVSANARSGSRGVPTRSFALYQPTQVPSLCIVQAFKQDIELGTPALHGDLMFHNGTAGALVEPAPRPPTSNFKWTSSTIVTGESALSVYMDPATAKAGAALRRLQDGSDVFPPFPLGCTLPGGVAADAALGIGAVAGWQCDPPEGASDTTTGSKLLLIDLATGTVLHRIFSQGQRSPVLKDQSAQGPMIMRTTDGQGQARSLVAMPSVSGAINVYDMDDGALLWSSNHQAFAGAYWAGSYASNGDALFASTLSEADCVEDAGSGCGLTATVSASAATTGQALWSTTFSTAGPVELAVSNDVVFASTATTLHALHRDTGAVLSSLVTATDGRSALRPTVVGAGLVYQSSFDELTVIGLPD